MIETGAAQGTPTFAVWVPKLGGVKKHVGDATTVVPDARTKHYWDDQGAVMDAYTKAMRFKEDAWDIYLIYGPDARWTEDGPPTPTYWMHQLGSPGNKRVDGPYLDARTFAAKLEALRGSR